VRTLTRVTVLAIPDFAERALRAAPSTKGEPAATALGQRSRLHRHRTGEGHPARHGITVDAAFK
jgi:hypothetical protein